MEERLGCGVTATGGTPLPRPWSKRIGSGYTWAVDGPLVRMTAGASLDKAEGPQRRR